MTRATVQLRATYLRIGAVLLRWAHRALVVLAVRLDRKAREHERSS